MGFPLEYFTPSNLRHWQLRFGTNGIKDTYEMIKRYRTSPNGCFGCKLHFMHFKMLFGEKGIEDSFPNAKFVFVRRRDLMAQAVSLAKAKQTGSWISYQKPAAEATYSRSEIEKALKDILRDNARWEYLFSRRGWPCYEVYYEDFLERPTDTITEIGVFLGLEVRPGLNFTFGQLPQRQSDHLNQQFRERYLLEVQESSFAEELEFLRDIEGIPVTRIALHLLGRIRRKMRQLTGRR